ncbi:SAM-dependent methyltransferase [Spirillospora sp. NPDC048819]|uniref:class I SAM-dependent methyltransferase n=1 Tax=Spirillospora sp. NPDC048819 TaxID=3155268 RepID=UPI0033DD474B
MSSGLASHTAQRVAEVRAVDAIVEPGRRLLDDRYAKIFFPPGSLPSTPGEAMDWLLANDRRYGGYTAMILLRHRCFQDHLVRAAAAGAEQAVLLGAGYDTTALRLTEPGRMRWFEVDHPSTQRDKLAALTRAGVSASSVEYVPMDFESGRSLGDALIGAGFDRDKPCVVGWLGVTFFLRPEAFQNTLAELAALCAPGSTLVFDYMDQSVLDGTTPYEVAVRTNREMGAKGEPYLSGLTPETADAVLRRAGFETVAQFRVPDLVKNHGGPDPYCVDDDFMGVVVAERS